MNDAAAGPARTLPSRDSRWKRRSTPVADRPNAPPPNGCLTKPPNRGRILVSPAAAIAGRAQSAPPTPRVRNTPFAPALDTEPYEERTAPAAAPTSAMSARETREPEGNRQQHDDSHRHRLGGWSVRGDAPHAAPLVHRDPTLLQHEWLHLIPRGRPPHVRRDVSDLRLHPPRSVERTLDRSAGSVSALCWPDPHR